MNILIPKCHKGNSDFLKTVFYIREEFLLQKGSFRIDKQKYLKHFSALQLHINEIEIPQITTSIYIQITAFPLCGYFCRALKPRGAAG